MARKPPKKETVSNKTKSNPAGWTLEQIKERVVHGKGNIKLTAELLNISRKTFYEWMEKWPELKQDMTAANEGQVDHVESKLFDLIDRGETAAIIFYLKTKGKHRGYVERTEQATVEPIRLRIVEEVIEAETNGATQNGRSQNPTESGAA